jgi:methionine-rich copper-binding protein CopC
MFKTRLFAMGFAAAALVAFPAIAQGHDHHSMHEKQHGDHGSKTGLASSSPGDGQVVGDELKVIVLEFDHPMVPKSVQLMTDAMERITLDVSLPETAVERVEIPLSETLEPGGYQVSWRAGAEDHEMSGAFTFDIR